MTKSWRKVMAFTFRLEQVLSYRKQLEEQAMQQYGLSIAARDAVKDRIEEVLSLITSIRQSLLNIATMTAGEMWVARSSESAYLAELKELYVSLEEKEHEVEHCRQIVITKAQERELLDKLKEKQSLRYSLEQRLAEQRNNDETATLRFKPASY